MNLARAARAALIWAALVAAVAIPLAASAASPLLAYRSPIYITAGFAGVIALGLLLVQPVLMSGGLPGFPGFHGRRAHRWVGAALVLAVVVHVAGLWITSPPDVIDALLFNSPTPFSAWGVIAMWAIFASALLAIFQRRLPLRPRTWRMIHTFFAAVIVVGGVVHSVLIEGTMETWSKAALCVLVLAATIKVMATLKVWTRRRAHRPTTSSQASASGSR